MGEGVVRYLITSEQGQGLGQVGSSASSFMTHATPSGPRFGWSAAHSVERA
jgi:hypothetical protein